MRGGQRTRSCQSGLYHCRCPLLWTLLWSTVQSIRWLPGTSEYDCLLVVEVQISKSVGNRSIWARTCWHILVWWSPVDVWGLIEDGDWVGHAIGGRGEGSGVERGVIRQAMETFGAPAGTTDLAGQRLVHVELCGHGTAAIVVQVVFAAQLAPLTQGRLAGCLLLLEITEAWRTEEVKGKKYNHEAYGECTTVCQNWLLCTNIWSNCFLA